MKYEVDNDSLVVEFVEDLEREAPNEYAMKWFGRNSEGLRCAPDSGYCCLDREPELTTQSRLLKFVPAKDCLDVGTSF